MNNKSEVLFQEHWRRFFLSPQADSAYAVRPADFWMRNSPPPAAQRAIEAWPNIDFEDDREGTLFKAIVRRRHQSSESIEVFAPETAPETQDLHQKPSSSGANPQAFSPETAPEIAPELLELLKCLAANPRITIAELADVLKVSRRTVLTRINTLKTKGLLRRIGPNKGGQWELIP